MRFNEIYKKGGPHFSIEVFPPKTAQGTKLLFEELQKVAKISPAYISVTYGAMGSTRDFTRDLALTIHQELKLPVAFHFTCMGSGREAIKQYVQALADAGLQMIVALRGDQPKNSTDQAPADGFSHANELVEYLRSLHDFSIAVAGYPEKHPEAASFREDIDHLKRKVDAGADIIITQLFFDNSIFYRWLDRVRAAGIFVPVLPGIMPIQKLAQIEKIAQLSGAKIPDVLLEKLRRHAHDDQAILDIGVEQSRQQVQNLLQNGLPGVHFYCLNKAEPVLRVIKGLKRH